MATTLVLIRHAQRSSNFAGDDNLCPISPEGKRRTENLAQKLVKANIRPSIIFYSPTTRTLQTAAVLAEAFKAPTQECADLSLWGDVHGLLPFIPSEGTIFMVGHGPTLESFASHLLSSGSIGVIMRSSSALILQFDSTPAFHAASFVQYLGWD